MRAITVVPGKPESVRVQDVPEPVAGPDQALLETLLVGICGTDHEILAGLHGAAPAGSPFLIPGHECLARVVSAPPDSDLHPGDLVVPTARRPCGDPACLPCAAGRSDMCVTLRYTERGIQGAQGFQCERFVEEPRYLIPVPSALGTSGVLVEPTSVVAKAITEAVAVQRLRVLGQARTALVTGAGPVGLLGAMLLRSLGLRVTVYDRVDAASARARAAVSLGARYVSSQQCPLETLAAGAGYDWILECTGAPSVVFGVIPALGPSGILCLLGVSAGTQTLAVPGAELNGLLVTRNAVVLGSVNASREAFRDAVWSLGAAQVTWPGWTEGLITRAADPSAAASALAAGPQEIKVVVRWRAL